MPDHNIGMSAMTGMMPDVGTGIGIGTIAVSDMATAETGTAMTGAAMAMAGGATGMMIELGVNH